VPLNVLQLLWVNMIMDTMGALALATEDPHPKLLDQAPNGQGESLINPKMTKHIVIQVRQPSKHMAQAWCKTIIFRLKLCNLDFVCVRWFCTYLGAVKHSPVLLLLH
jgi:hypothetical protein